MHQGRARGTHRVKDGLPSLIKILVVTNQSARAQVNCKARTFDGKGDVDCALPQRVDVDREALWESCHLA